MPKRFGLPKSERLKSRKQIEDLFAGGKSFVVFPLRVTYRLFPAGCPAGLQIGVTASKRYYKRAVDRNRIKRLLREAYRLQKATLQQQLAETGQSGAVFFLYTGKTIAPFSEVATAMDKCLKKLREIAQREPAA